MSLDLYWEPTPPEQGKRLPFALKALIVKQLGNGISIERLTIFDGTADAAYIRGLRDAGVEGAAALVEALEKYDSVDLWTA